MKQLFRPTYTTYQNELPFRAHHSRKKKPKPLFSIFILAIILFGCIFSSFLGNSKPYTLDLYNLNVPPNKTFWFGTDSLGRNIFNMIWYGGRISLFIGLLATLISTIIGVLYGSISAIAPSWLETLLLRFSEILLSIPNILLIIFLQAILGKNNIISLAIIIGISSWMPLAKIIRTEVKQIWQLDYIAAARLLGANFCHLLRLHLLPNYFPTIIFILISNIGGAIATESILSFLGIGLPIDILSWGSMLALAEQALLANYWWIIVIPAFFLITTIICLTNIAEYLRQKNTNDGHYL